MRRVLIVVGALAFALVASTMLRSSPSRGAFFGFANAAIVYVSERNGTSDIRLLRGELDGDGNLDLCPGAPADDRANAVVDHAVISNPTAQDRAPTSSQFPVADMGLPGGALPAVAFQSDADGDSEIYTVAIALDGDALHVSLPEQLTVNQALDGSPAWGPGPKEESLIAFVSNRSGNREIFVMNADGSNPRNLTRSAANDEEPAWSPDGDEIAFISDRSGTRELYAIAADGIGPVRQLTDGPSPKNNPSWQGFPVQLGGDAIEVEHIVFDSPRLEFGPATSPSGDSEIYRVQRSGGSQVRIAGSGVDDRDPVWSPNGTCVAFESNRTGVWQIYVMTSGGQIVSQLTSQGANHSADWQQRNTTTDEGRPQPPAHPPATGTACVRTGNSGPNRLIGSPGRDVMCGKGGKDLIIGRGGGDIISGGSGRDRISGGSGADQIDARDAERDRVRGGRGRDMARLDRRRIDQFRSIEVPR